MPQFIVTIPDTDAIPAFLDFLAESDEFSEFIDAHSGVLIGFLDMVFDHLTFHGRMILPSEESQQCPEDPFEPVDAELAALQDKRISQYRAQYGDVLADAYDTERALERIQS